MIVEVTQEDIDGAIPGSACRCPVARAFKRLGAYYAGVVPVPTDSPYLKVRICHSDRGEDRWFVAGAEACAAVIAYDRGGSLTPMLVEFEEVTGKRDLRSRTGDFFMEAA